MQTQKKGALLKSALMLGALAFVLSGCADGGRTGKTKNQTSAVAAPTATLPTSIQNIAYVTFSLPEQVQWEANQDPQLAKSGIAEWIVKGTTAQSTPARVMYQKLSPAQSTSQLKGQVTSTLPSCADSKVTDLRGTSQYRNYITFETICSKLGKNKYGLIDYVSIFTDGESNHVVLAEIKTPPSKKAGVLDAKTAQAQKQAETAKVLAELLNKTIQSVRACDANQRCI